MKILRLFIVISLAITISYFSWSYYTSRSLKEKHERAILVFDEHCNRIKISGLERFYVYE